MKEVGILLIAIVLVSCEKSGILSETADPLKSTDIPTYTTQPVPVITNSLSVEAAVPTIADNYSLAELKVTSTTTAPVTFVIDRGLFSNNSTTFIATNNTLQKVAYLKHSKTEKIVVGITSTTVVTQATVDFITSYPDLMLLEAQTYAMQPVLSSMITVTAKLRKDLGTVSPGHQVIFSDSAQSSGNSKGVFLNITKSNDGGDAQGTYLIQDTTFRGAIYIRAKVQTPSGEIRARNRIVVKY